MATEPVQTLNRIDSADDGFSSLPDTLNMAKALRAAVIQFSSESGLRLLSNLVDQIPQLQKDIQGRDKHIKELDAQLAAEKEGHHRYDQRQLRMYADAYEDWKNRETALNDTLQELREASEHKDRNTATLQETLEESETRIGELQSKQNIAAKKANEREQEISDLKTKLQVAQASAHDFSKKLSESQQNAKDLADLLRQKEEAYEKLETNNTKIKERLRDIIKFSVPLKDLDVEDMASELEELWGSATHLIETFINVDLPEKVLQNEWNKLHDNTVFKHQIPLPHSNSDIAKEMRVATVLGIFARLINVHLFQPTYLLDEASGFRTLMRRQVLLDQRKERFARGIMLSMFPEDQEANGKDAIDDVIDELFTTIDLPLFFSRTTCEEFEEALEVFLIQVQTAWKTVQFSKPKLEPNFTHSTSSSLTWRSFELQAASTKHVERSPSTAIADDVEDDVVIFPRFYLMETDAEPSPITAGAVLRKAQLRAAMEEVRRIPSTAPFAPSSQGRNRRLSRAMSSAGSGVRGVRKEKNFLA